MANLYDQIPKDGYPKAPNPDGSGTVNASDTVRGA